MNLHVVLEDRILATTPRARTPVRSLSVRRGDVLTLDVTFSLNGVIGPLPAGTGISVAGYAGFGSRLPLVYAEDPLIVGRGPSTIYRFPAVSFALDDLDASFSSQATVQLVFELRINVGYAGFTTAPVTLNVTQSADTGAAVPPVFDPVPTSPLYIKEITSLTGGGATALDGVVTVGRPGLLVMCYVSNEMQTWKLFAGTDADNPSAGVVRPDDYHATANPQVWKRVL